MTKEDDFKLLKFQTCDLRVNIHCDGCKLKVKKLLHRIEGVFQVVIGAENQKVTVLGSVDSATLINKLVRAGKHAELWSQKANSSPKPKNKDDKSPNKGPKPSLNSLNCEDVDIDGFFGGEEGEDCEALPFQFKAADFDLLRRQAMGVSNAKKGDTAIGQIPGPAMPNGKMNINNIKPGNGKKIDSHQPMAIRNTPSEIDQKTLEALKMNNAQPFATGIGRGSINPGELARGNNNDLNSMMNMAGFTGNNPLNFAALSTIGANSTHTPQGGLHLHPQQNNNGYGYQPSSTAGFSMATGQYHHQQQQQQQQPTAMNGYNNNQYNQQPFVNMNNMLNRQAQAMSQQQPQMMYNRAQMVPPSTGYYYNYNPSPVHPNYPFGEAGYYHHHQQGHNSNSAADMFSDENTSSSCSIM